MARTRKSSKIVSKVVGSTLMNSELHTYDTMVELRIVDCSKPNLFNSLASKRKYGT